MIYEDFLDSEALRLYAAALNRRAQALRISSRIDSDGLRGRILDSAGRCEWCGRSLLYQPFEVDHIMALGQGGANDVQNLAIACPDCNRNKGGKHPARFAQEQIARGGALTPLIAQLLAHFDIAPQVQRGLFDEAITPEQKPDDAAAEDETPPDSPPPYRWS